MWTKFSDFQLQLKNRSPYVPPIECPTQWKLFALSPSWNIFVSVLPACFAMTVEIMTEEWSVVSEYCPQSSSRMLWSFRLMYAFTSICEPSLSKSSVHPGNRKRPRRQRVISELHNRSLSMKRVAAYAPWQYKTVLRLKSNRLWFINELKLFAAKRVLLLAEGLALIKAYYRTLLQF